MLQKNKKTNCETRQRSPPAHLNVRPPTVAAHPPTWSHYPESIIVQLFNRAWGCRGGENCPSSKRTVPWAFLDLHQPPRGAESDRTNPSWQHPDFLGNIEAFLGKIQASWARSRLCGQGARCILGMGPPASSGRLRWVAKQPSRTTLRIKPQY